MQGQRVTGACGAGPGAGAGGGAGAGAEKGSGQWADTAAVAEDQEAREQVGAVGPVVEVLGVLGQVCAADASAGGSVEPGRRVTASESSVGPG